MIDSQGVFMNEQRKIIDEMRAVLRERDKTIAEWREAAHIMRLQYMEAESQLTTANARIATLTAALTDMLSGWRYIRENHGDLYGVGWERAEQKAKAALAGWGRQ